MRRAPPIPTVGLACLSALLLSLAPAGAAQEQPPSFRFSHLTAEDGLSQGMVYAAVQDRQGTLWAGTSEGRLNRFDPDTGTFAHRSIAADARGMPHVWSLLEDTRGMLWVGTWDGLFRYDRTTGTFTRFRPAPADQTAQGRTGAAPGPKSRRLLYFLSRMPYHFVARRPR